MRNNYLNVLAIGSVILASAPAFARSYVGGHFELQLDGVSSGILQKCEGGDIEGTVTTLPVAHDYYVKKQLSNLKYNEFSVQMGLSMSEPVRAWVEAALAGKQSPKNGAILVLDAQNRVREVREFSNAVLTEITFPGGDSDGKDPGYLNLKWQPEKIWNTTGSGKVESNPADVNQKTYMPSNFEVTIDGLDSTKVTRFEPLTIKLGKAGTAIDFPDFVVTQDESNAGTYENWFEDFVIKGNNDETKHRNGSITYHSTNLKSDLLTLNLHTMGVYKGTPDALENAKDAVRRTHYTSHIYQWYLAVGKSPNAYAKTKDKKSAGRSPASVLVKPEK